MKSIFKLIIILCSLAFSYSIECYPTCSDSQYKVYLCFEDTTSTHIFNTKEEARRFVRWIQNYNADLNITIEESNNENNDVTSESSTFI